MGNQITTSKASRGQKIVQSHGLDNASSMKLDDQEARMGKEMGGSTTNLSHSLTGASAVQQVKKGGGK